MTTKERLEVKRLPRKQKKRLKAWYAQWGLKVTIRRTPTYSWEVVREWTDGLDAMVGFVQRLLRPESQQ